MSICFENWLPNIFSDTNSHITKKHTVKFLQIYISPSMSEPLLALISVQFNSVTQLCPTLCNPMNTARQASLSITNSRSSWKPMSIESVRPSSHLVLCRPFLLQPSIFPSIRVFPNESVLCMGGQSIGVSASMFCAYMNLRTN